MKGMNPTTLRAQELKDQCAHDLDGAEKEDFGDRWGWIEVLISCLPSHSRQGQQSWTVWRQEKGRLNCQRVPFSFPPKFVVPNVTIK